MTQLQATMPAALSGASPVVSMQLICPMDLLDPLARFGGGGEEGKQNMGDAEAILGG